jgi:hypothetical protein
MKLSRLRTLGTLAVAGTLTGATLVLAASQASAMPTDGFVDGCVGTGGRVGIGTYYDFDVNGNVVSQNQVLTCRWGSSVRWNETDIHGNPYGELVRSIFRIACRAHFGPGLWPGPRRQARWAGRGLRRSRAGPEDRFCEAG